jgi:hypothetical protein
MLESMLKSMLSPTLGPMPGSSYQPGNEHPNGSRLRLRVRRSRFPPWAAPLRAAIASQLRPASAGPNTTTARRAIVVLNAPQSTTPNAACHFPFSRREPKQKLSRVG